VIGVLLKGRPVSDVTRILSKIERGDPSAAEQLLPLVYDEMRKLAAQKLAQEKPGQTLQATALVHEAYIRLVDVEQAQPWDSRGHFFAAAAEAMRRILVERARRKQSQKHGGDWKRIELNEAELASQQRADEMLAIDEALDELQQHDAQAAALVKLRFFAGFGHQEAAEMLGITRRTADRLWATARAWMYARINKG
jgi:RNA polymerase sigma factor (TIGR02999 family)